MAFNAFAAKSPTGLSGPRRVIAKNNCQRTIATVFSYQEEVTVTTLLATLFKFIAGELSQELLSRSTR